LRPHRTQAGSDEHHRLDRAIVLELLEDRKRRTRDQLAAAVRVDRGLLDGALKRLQTDGLAVIDGEDVLASRCARRIDELDLIGI
jgi:hypothetical protein